MIYDPDKEQKKPFTPRPRPQESAPKTTGQIMPRSLKKCEQCGIEFSGRYFEKLCPEHYKQKWGY